MHGQQRDTWRGNSPKGENAKRDENRKLTLVDDDFCSKSSKMLMLQQYKCTIDYENSALCRIEINLDLPLMDML